MREAEISKYRRPEIEQIFRFRSGRDIGYYAIPIDGETATVKVIAEGRYDHFLVSFPTRAPNWNELVELCKIMFDPSETVVEPSGDAIGSSVSPRCRHMMCVRRDKIRE
jgi:hypothetical protein